MTREEALSLVKNAKRLAYPYLVRDCDDKIVGNITTLGKGYYMQHGRIVSCADNFDDVVFFLDKYLYKAVAFDKRRLALIREIIGKEKIEHPRLKDKEITSLVIDYLVDEKYQREKEVERVWDKKEIIIR